MTDQEKALLEAYERGYAKGVADERQRAGGAPEHVPEHVPAPVYGPRSFRDVWDKAIQTRLKELQPDTWYHMVATNDKVAIT